ncbi:MAG TPA: DUF4349 domain-containing protein [Solirubrobacteraceae bacterium]|nr:DUF4349 domain-containing protein [Solirubrobacteraceae bacterium]
MRVIPFGPPRMSAADAQELARIEAALDGDGTGGEAEYWRELRADVRALGEPLDPGFARALEQRLQEAQRPARSAPRIAATAIARRRGPALAVGASLLAVLLAVLVFGVPGSGHAPPQRSAAEGLSAPAAGKHAAAAPLVAGDREEPVERRAESGPREQAAAAAGPAGEAPGEGGGRLQRLSASLTLGTGGEGVQQVADRVGRATVAAGGFVQSAHVQTARGSAGEALLTLVLPSPKLQSTLARLERIASVRGESQSLQDISGEFHAAAGRLTAARAERAALLRALAGASTAAAVESIHVRLAEVGRRISTAERQQASITHQASQAQVEVTVLGESHHGGGSTLGRGVSDAGKVLTVSLAVLVVAAAVLVPLGLVIAAVVLGGRAWRRQRRERVLGSG